MTRRRRNSERGVTLIFVAVLLVVLIGFIALVVDVGKMYKVRGELQNASDAAAHAAALSLDGTRAGIAQARERAKEYAAMHDANRTGVALTDADIIFGHWDTPTRTWTPLGTDPMDALAVNAVRVVDHRSQATGDPVVLHFAPLLGVSRANEHTDAIAIAGGPMSECGFPMVVADCTLNQALGDGTCAHCMTYQDNNSDTAGWTSFDAGSIGGPKIAALIRSACFSGNTVNVDPVTHECRGTCNDVYAGDQIKVQNGNLMSQGNNNFCPVIQTILRRGIANGTPQPFVVRVPVLQSTPGSTCDASQFSSFHTVAGFAAFEIFGAKCSNSDPGVFVPMAPCAPPPSGKYIVGGLRCDLESIEGVAGGGWFGLRAVHIRLVE